MRSSSEPSSTISSTWRSTTAAQLTFSTSTSLASGWPTAAVIAETQRFLVGASGAISVYRRVGVTTSKHSGPLRCAGAPGSAPAKVVRRSESDTVPLGLALMAASSGL